MTTATSEDSKAQPPIKVIDADTHLTEPHDMWIKRAPAKYKDRVPQVKMHEGVQIGRAHV